MASTTTASTIDIEQQQLQLDEDENSLYESTIRTLNSLQSNASVIEAARLKRQANPACNLVNTKHYLELLGISQSHLNKLNCIHVAGTKGKGSTCALTESILRSYGLKTALFTSPHLVEAKERLSINGEPMSKKKFSKYFWQVYKVLKDKSLESQAQGISELPTYFTFLTVMAYYSFHCESVDVAIIEVGVGGEYDCTNVLKKPIVTAITSLDLDHTILLGDSIDQIAWQKSGIFKNNVPAFTLDQQPAAMDVLITRAVEKSVEKLTVIPSILPALNSINLGIRGKIQKYNASLAVYLATTWLQRMTHFQIPDVTNDQCYHLPDKFVQGLTNCKWPGRFQVVTDSNNNFITYFMDGAHTKESIKLATEWFVDESNLHSNNSIRVLMVYITGYRDSDDLLKTLSQIYAQKSEKETFDYIIFSPNLRKQQHSSCDLLKLSIDVDKEQAKASSFKSIWLDLVPNQNANSVVSTGFIEDAINYIRNSISPETNLPIHVLVTGSLLLVGSTLSFIKPT